MGGGEEGEGGEGEGEREGEGEEEEMKNVWKLGMKNYKKII